MTNAKQVWHRYGRAIGPIGTAGRAALGVAFFLVVLLIPEGGALRWYEAALNFVIGTVLFVNPLSIH